jgi:hypothetical protein
MNAATPTDYYITPMKLGNIESNCDRISGVKTSFVSFVILALPFFPAAVSAQWPDYKAAAVPRTEDGKVKMDAPAPKTADGKTDFSGVWAIGRAGGGGGRGGAFGRGGGRGGPAPDAAGGPPPPPAAPPQPRVVPELKPGEIPAATFGNIGAGFKDGLPLLPAAAELLARRKGENSKDNPDAHCLPLGLMQLHGHPQPRKIAQMPNLMVIMYEAQAGLRQIFLDGRPLPPKDAQPWWYGYSVGHWDGDTLVVETTGFRDDVWLDVAGSPLTNSGKLTERFRRPNFGSLEIDVTVEDPKVYTKPFTVRVNQRLMADTDLIEFICGENERSDAHLVGK